MSKSDPRTVAFELLVSVLHEKRPFDDALASHRRLKGMPPRDRALARLLAATVLRRLPELDAMIAPLLNKPLRGQARIVQNLLRLGAAQFVFLDTPAHAVVSTTVAAAQSSGQRAYKGLINAVLRRLTSETITPAANPAKMNVPDWLWKSWADAYGAETAMAIAEAHLRESALDITVKSDPEAWAEKLEAELLPTGSLRRAAGGDIRALPGFDDGAWWIQDAAAALPVALLNPSPGQTIVDMCAAPGGKTAQLAAAGANVHAVDISEKRMKQVKDNLWRLRLKAQRTVADAAEWMPEAPVDAVLLDAPCSGTGTIRRHPDIARLKKPADIQRLTEIQDRLLTHCADILRPGGLLVYATCSLQPEEGSERIEKLLANGAPLERVPVTAAELPGLESAITANGEVRTLPSHWAERGGLDGFFIVRLKRV